MNKKLVVIPERCSGCRICELVCSIKHFKVNNPKKSAIRVIVHYPHPIIRMPVVCHQCKEPKCAENCPTDAIYIKNGTVLIDEEKCISCHQCVTSCPFGAIFVHQDLKFPIKCDLCGSSPECVAACPKKALLYIPENLMGQAMRVASALKYAKLKEVEYVEKGEMKKIKYTSEDVTEE